MYSHVLQCITMYSHVMPCIAITIDVLPCIANTWQYLTNRFHVAVHLFSNRSQMTSKCGRKKKVANEAIAECVTDVLTTF